MIVADASAIVELLLRSPRAERIAHRLFARRQTLHAPHLLDAEVLHSLRRQYHSGRLSVERGNEAVTDFIDLRISRHSHLPLLDRIWDLRENLTAYDACYVGLAEYLQAPLVTVDAQLAASKGHSAKIELIS